MTALNSPLTLANSFGTATVYEQGAHVATWTPAGHDPVLFLSERANFRQGAAIRGGVPICFPWFGPGRDGDRSPAHGYARTTAWHLVSADDSVAVLSMTQNDFAPEAREAFPQPFSCEYTISVGAALKLELATTNTGDHPLEIEEALHTYIAVGDIHTVSVDGLDGVSYVDKVSGEAEVTQNGAVTFTGETDRVYRSGAPLTVTDPTLGRRLRVTTLGAANTVVWNPWDDKAQKMSDFADDEWTRMLCIEGANALDDFVTIAPGETHAITYHLEVD
ncbi:MAG: D-hexose-6-phosphate mutarotase [Kocuria sp.]|nr:D-hexose-6-phosphate mutarotase [Kocuria sp.]